MYTRYTAWNRNYQFQLDNDLYYALNDINIKSHEISISFQVQGNLQLNFDVSTYQSSSANTFGELSAYIDHLNTINMTSVDVNDGEYYPIKVSDGKGFNNGANYCGGLTEQYGFCQYEEYNLPKTTYSKDRLTFSTDYMELDAISPLTFSVGILNQYFQGSSTLSLPTIDPSEDGWALENLEVDMKLIIDIVFHDLDENGDNITETLAFTYDVDNIEWVTSPIESDLQNSPTNYGTFEKT